MNLVLEVLTGGVRGGTSIMYAALGETVSERAGVVNLGTEGSMLAGACAGYAIAAQTGNPWLGALGGAVAGDSLQLDSGLPAATANILTGLILIAVLGWTGTRKKASTR